MNIEIKMKTENAYKRKKQPEIVRRALL